VRETHGWARLLARVWLLTWEWLGLRMRARILPVQKEIRASLKLLIQLRIGVKVPLLE
jgi:hypothetical protein